MLYGDYIANLTQLALDISNTGTARGHTGIPAAATPADDNHAA